MFKTPILFLIFNRPNVTKIVFERIREIKPKYLFIAADGPRVDNSGEALACQETRELVLNGIDWTCEVKTLFREQNNGCGKAVNEAITWFFTYVEEGIILEDDCVPIQSFFNYCETLLEKYRDSENIYVISGNNFQSKKRGSGSYYFSAYAHIWGWATWKRAWDRYDFSLLDVDDSEFNKCLKKYFRTKQERDFWFKHYNIMKYHPLDTWDYQWLFTVWINGGITILPNLNLVTNIGFDEFATHTKQFKRNISNLSTFDLENIDHPKNISINKVADLYTFKKLWSNKTTLFDRYRTLLKIKFLNS